MEIRLREQFLAETAKQLGRIYSDLKLRQKLGMKMKHRTEGYMYAGQQLGLVSKEELESLMEKMHFEVFAMSIAERRLQTLKGEQQEIDGSYYDTPITQR